MPPAFLKLDSRTRIALDVLGELAASPPARVTAVHLLARAVRASPSSLEKLLAELRAAGIVTALRGPGGGYRLAAAPAAIRLLDVWRALERGPGPGERAADSEEPPSPADSPVWARCDEFLYDQLSGITLADALVPAVSAARVSPEPASPEEQGRAAGTPSRRRRASSVFDYARTLGES